MLDWTGNRDDLTSILAFVKLLFSNPISWCSKKQCTVVRFVYEAKYHAIAFAIVETTWILNSMFEFCISYLNPYGEVRATTFVSLIFVPTQSFFHSHTLFEIK